MNILIPVYEGFRVYRRSYWWDCHHQSGNGVDINGRGVHSGLVLVVFVQRVHQVQYTLAISALWRFDKVDVIHLTGRGSYYPMLLTLFQNPPAFYAGLFQLQMRISFLFLRAKDLCTSLLIIRTGSFYYLLYIGGTYAQGQ